MIQGRGTQVGSETVQSLLRVVSDPAQIRRAGTELRIVGGLLEQPKTDLERCQRLPRFVVELAGDRATLVLLEIDELPGERLETLALRRKLLEGFAFSIATAAGAESAWASRRWL